MTTATKYKTYPKYEPSGIDWLGVIPAGWEVKKLKYGFYFTKGKNAALYTAEYNAEHAGDYPVYSGQTEGEGVMGSIDSYDYDFEKVIFTTTVGAKVMTPLLLSGKFSLSQNCLLMIKSSKQVHEKYFYYQLFPLFDREKSLVPSHMQPSLRFSDLNTFDVAYPEIDEQKEIVAFLDRETAKIDEMVAKKQKMMELLKEKRQALITNAVTKGLYPKVKMKPSGIDWLGDIPDEWEVKRLNYLISNIVDKAADTSENNFIVALENLESWTGNLLSPKDQKLPEGDLKTFSEGDVLFGKLRPYLAKALLAEQKGLCVGEALVFRTKKELLNKFLIYRILTKEFINYIDSSTQGAKMPRAEWEFIKTLQIAYPSIENQKRIVDHIERETARIDEMMKKVEMQIEKLQEYRQALITSAVTGKIMVN
jgi:restriction endonuclease S subunit